MSRDRRRWMRHGLEELPMRRRAVLESSTDDERGQRQERKTPLPEEETFERPRTGAFQTNMTEDYGAIGNI